MEDNLSDFVANLKPSDTQTIYYVENGSVVAYPSNMTYHSERLAMHGPENVFAPMPRVICHNCGSMSHRTKQCAKPFANPALMVYFE